MTQRESRGFSGRSTRGRAGLDNPRGERRKGPWVEIKTYSFHPALYRSMVGRVSGDARSGDLVAVYDRKGKRFAWGLYNASARVPVRVYAHAQDHFGEEGFLDLIGRAVSLRRSELDLEASTQAYRAVHSDGDGLSGLVVDKLGSVLSIQVHALGIYSRIGSWIPVLKDALDAEWAVVEVDDKVADLEGIAIDPALSDSIRYSQFEEHGIRYEADFRDGHKTGFFCDQRENRKRFRQLASGREVLDLCCYSGGFALNALAGGAASVTAVDLDEKAIGQARRNANLNGQARVNWTHCDAFSFMRQMQRNGRQWDLLNLDPPKLIFGREQQEQGMKKYEDLNQLACSLIRPGGLFATYSCSGQLSAEAFEEMVIRSAHRARRSLQILERTGAGPDHPVMSNCPESRYLKALWCRVS